MSINKIVEEIGFFADKAQDEKDIETLRKISEDCLEIINEDGYTELEKGILAYHGATSCSNLIFIKHKNILFYDNDDQTSNEEDFEYSMYLYRKSIECLTEFKKQSIGVETDQQELIYCEEYLKMSYTNYSNFLHQCGRIIRGIHHLRKLVGKGFPMAIGNYAGFLIDYGDYDYDPGHKALLANEAYRLLSELLTNKVEFIHQSAKDHFVFLKRKLESVFDIDFLENSMLLDEYNLGECDDEISYRKWCLENVLFLNQLNDVFATSAVSQDILHLPNIVTKIDEGTRIHGLFNQLKQEYVSARYMVFDGLYRTQTHFSDKEVHLVNTLDYPVYGLGVEKLKYAYRSLYSLFDRIAFLINDYFQLGIKDHDVSFRSIWN
ncbi:hypothetical protein A9D36_09610, partial [Bacillus subtilis]